MSYEPIIGLEIHVQLKTASKLFCSSPNDFKATHPNTNICEICTGQPGTLPRLNIEALKKAILVGLTLNCKIADYIKFDRKNYFYPDLPKGYQISQFDQPINGRGFLEINGRRIGITRAHLEEDAGKLLHSPDGKSSLVDFNRAGVPLLEIVTEPDFRSAREAGDFLRQLRSIVRYLGVSDADMEKGHLRVDANVSVRHTGEADLPNYKVEIKNVNSFKAVEAALNYEIERQTKAIENGEELYSETRGYIDSTKTTASQRIKEEAHDYRYFPEPDLPPIEIPQSLIEELRNSINELPHQKAVRFVKEYELPDTDIAQIVAEKDIADYFEHIASELEAWYQADGIDENQYKKSLKAASNWLLGDFFALLNRDAKSVNEIKITPENFAELIKMVEKGEISSTAGKTVLAEMYATGSDPSEIVERLNLKQVSDTSQIEEVADKVIGENKEVVDKYKAGKTTVIGVLVGLVMKEMGGRANPKVVNEVMKAKLEK